MGLAAAALPRLLGPGLAVAARVAALVLRGAAAGALALAAGALRGLRGAAGFLRATARLGLGAGLVWWGSSTLYCSQGQLQAVQVSCTAGSHWQAALLGKDSQA